MSVLGAAVIDLKTTCKHCNETPIYCAQKININFDKLINLEANHSELGALLARQINELMYQRDRTRCHKC
jgi:hypothetical protein